MLKKLGYVWLVQLVHPQFLIIAGEILDNPCLSGWQDAAGVGLPNAAGRDLLRRLLQWDPNERIQGPGRLRNVMAGMAQQ